MTTYKNFKINARFQGVEANKVWGDTEPHAKYFVYVTNSETGAKTRFTFWDSLANTEKGIKALDDYSTLNAFYYFVSDSLSGCDTFSDFCGEFGYDEDSRNAYRIYTACKRACKSWARVSGMDESETCDFLNELQEIAG